MSKSPSLEGRNATSLLQGLLLSNSEKRKQIDMGLFIGTDGPSRQDETETTPLFEAQEDQSPPPTWQSPPLTTGKRKREGSVIGLAKEPSGQTSPQAAPLYYAPPDNSNIDGVLFPSIINNPAFLSSPRPPISSVALGKQPDKNPFIHTGESSQLQTPEFAPSASPNTLLDRSDTSSLSAPSSVSNPALEVDAIHDPNVNAPNNNNEDENEQDDDDDDDADSAVDGMDGSSTQSVRESLYDYVVENGRTYHRYKEGKYIMPNDASEQERLDLQHQLALILLDGKLHLAPIGKHPQWVLDIGTGTGVWAIQFAEKYPSAQVIGTDLSPIQPLFVPPNCAFEVDDAEDDWIFPQKFDFIHVRGMCTCFTDPRAIISKAFEFLAPGGWLELQDGVFPMQCRDGTLSGTALEAWVRACMEGGERLGRRWTHVQHYGTWLQELGFEDIRVKAFEIPINTWPKGQKAKLMGMWFQADLLEGLAAMMAVLTRGLGWDVERCEKLLVNVRKDVNDRGIHAYLPVYFVWGRKPRNFTAQQS